MIIFEIKGRNGKLKKKKELIIIFGIICQKYCIYIFKEIR